MYLIIEIVVAIHLVTSSYETAMHWKSRVFFDQADPQSWDSLAFEQLLLGHGETTTFLFANATQSYTITDHHPVNQLRLL